MDHVRYGIRRTLHNTEFDTAVERARAALATAGFGILAEIDIQGALKNKLDVDVPKQLILAACNPALAHRALGAEPDIGLLLPCNVVVREVDGGDISVAAIDPSVMFEVIHNPDMGSIAGEVEVMLRQALDEL